MEKLAKVWDVLVQVAGITTIVVLAAFLLFGGEISVKINYRETVNELCKSINK